MTQRPWQAKPSDRETEQRLSETLRISPLMARLLLGRGLTDPGKIDRFLQAKVEHIPDPFTLAEMDQATDRILRAVSGQEDVLIFGDYDVDGITGTAQLVLFLKELGLKARTLLPHRLQDGYGLSPQSVKKILASPPKLLITIDNGTNALVEITELVHQGVEVIVIDHHETPNQRPPVVALLNPKRSDTPFEEKNIASAGLVFLLLMALRKKWRTEKGASPTGTGPNLKRYLDLACLGTIADVVPLIGLNRILVKHGLEELTRTTRAGLKALKDVAKIQGPVTPITVAFRIAPRINAAGRMADPSVALQLLTTEDPLQAYELAMQLEGFNRDRQGVEEKMTQEAEESVAASQLNHRCLVVASEGWHLGVAGIVAARLVERHRKPAIVLAIEGATARGSARTVESLSIYDVIRKANEGNPVLLKFGGHHAACGLSLLARDIEIFSHQLETVLNQGQFAQAEEASTPLWVDSFVGLPEINLTLLQEISQLEPFGAGNPEPLLAAEGVRWQNPRVVGTKHLKGQIVQGATQLEAIGFGMSNFRTLTAIEKIAFFPQWNEWNGLTSIQLKIKFISS